MQQSLEEFTAPSEGSAVAIGVFDGVHCGHQEILHQTAREAGSQGLAALALTFDIHPTELFRPDISPTYIASLKQRADLIARYGGGIDAVVVAHFDEAFAALPPHAFIADILEARLHARHVLVGADFCYGKGRAGTITSLVEAGARDGFAVTVVPPILVHGERVSSTQIRGLVEQGDLEPAVSLLGHPFVVQGQVVTGKQLGRTLGYPTANVQPTQPRQLIPANGIYAAFASLPDGRVFPSAVSVGTNPTTDQDGEKKIEAHLLAGFREDLYGQQIGLDFRQRIREETRFDSLDALVAQIERDVARITVLLSTASRF